MLRRLLAMPPRALGARCGARLGRAGSRLAALRSESNLHPNVPTGPASPRSPPLVAALRLARGLIWTIVSGLRVRRVAMERSEERHRGLLGRKSWRGGAGGAARRALGNRLRPAWSLYNAVGCREVVPDW